MIPYMNVGFEDNRFSTFTEEEQNMPRIFISRNNRYYVYNVHIISNNKYKFHDKNIVFNNKYEFKIWLNLNGYTIYRAYIYAAAIINNFTEDSYDFKCQLFLCRK